MIGLVLLLAAIACYFSRRWRWAAYLLYIGFLSNGYNVLTDSVLGIKNQDIAIVYTLLIGGYLLLSRRLRLPPLAVFRWLRVFIVFLIACVIFSLSYYGFTPFQVFQGSRNWLLIFCIPILIRMTPRESHRVLTIMGYITLLTAIVYIAQIIVGRPLLPYSGEGKVDVHTGLIRLYNFPPFLTFFLILSFLRTDLFRRVWLWRVALFVALICTQGRTSIFANILAILLAVWMQRGAGNLLKISVVLLILLIPFSDIITDRFEGGKTNVDLTSISQGAYEDYNVGSDQTMTFRLALLYERASYLIQRPVSEQLFGMGLISDSQPVVQKMYNFSIGLAEQETGNVTQLHSPDIAWVNTVCGIGFGGTAVYLAFLISLTIFFFRHRHYSYFFTAITAMALCSYITSFAGSTLSECRTLAIYFVVLSTIMTFGKRQPTPPIDNDTQKEIEG